MPQPPPPIAAKPTRSIFDPFNSSSTGHQRAENRLGHSTSWRSSRTLKLHAQFSSSDRGGGKRISDTVGAGSRDFGVDGRKENGGFVDGAPGLRGGGQRSLWELQGGVRVEKARGEGEGKRKRLKVEGERETKIVNPFTPFFRRDGSVREGSWPDGYMYGCEGVLKFETGAGAGGGGGGAIVEPPSPSEMLETLFTPPPSSESRGRHSPRSGQGTSSSPATQIQPTVTSISNENPKLEPSSSFSNIKTQDLLSAPASAQAQEEQEEQEHAEAVQKQPQKPPQIFTNLTFYINGSTAPYSDHHLKHLLTQHGGNLSISLARKTVTHVILGTPNNNNSPSLGRRHSGTGGGLSSSKIQKEVLGKTSSAAGKIRYVGAAWIVESCSAGKRLPEGKFEALRLAPKGVGRIEGMFARKQKGGGGERGGDGKGGE